MLKITGLLYALLVGGLTRLLLFCSLLTIWMGLNVLWGSAMTRFFNFVFSSTGPSLMDEIMQSPLLVQIFDFQMSALGEAATGWLYVGLGFYLLYSTFEYYHKAHSKRLLRLRARAQRLSSSTAQEA